MTCSRCFNVLVDTHNCGCNEPSEFKGEVTLADAIRVTEWLVEECGVEQSRPRLERMKAALAAGCQWETVPE